MRLVDLDDLITIENVSAMTGTSNPTVHKMVRAGQLPAPIRIAPRCVMFSRSAVQKALGLMGDPRSSDLMTAPAVAALLGISIDSLRQLHLAGEGPAARRHGLRGVRYLRREVLEYLKSTPQKVPEYEPQVLSALT